VQISRNMTPENSRSIRAATDFTSGQAGKSNARKRIETALQ
jgi:hypothetical protein